MWFLSSLSMLTLLAYPRFALSTTTDPLTHTVEPESVVETSRSSEYTGKAIAILTTLPAADASATFASAFVLSDYRRRGRQRLPGCPRYQQECAICR